MNLHILYVEVFVMVYFLNIFCTYSRHILCIFLHISAYNWHLTAVVTHSLAAWGVDNAGWRIGWTRFGWAGASGRSCCSLLPSL